MMRTNETEIHSAPGGFVIAYAAMVDLAPLAEPLPQDSDPSGALAASRGGSPMPASRRSLLTALVFVALAGVLALPSGVLAAKPVINRFGETYSFLVPADENPCGVKLAVAGEFRIVEHLFFDEAGNLVKVIGTFTDQWTETGPAGTVRGKAFGNVTTTDIVHDDGVESWVGTFRGLPGKFSAPGFGVVVRDAGNVAVARTLVVNDPDDPDDPDDDEFFQEITFEHGPHPTFPGTAQFNEEWIVDYCAIVAG
jgi:hypothetical protein